MVGREGHEGRRGGFDPSRLVRGQIYGMTNRKGDWVYKGYMKWSIYDRYGYYYFSNISNWFELFSTPLTADDVRNIIYKK